MAISTTGACSPMIQIIGERGEILHRACKPACARLNGVEAMNIFTIIGIVVVIILVAGYFGVHSFTF